MFNILFEQCAISIGPIEKFKERKDAARTHGQNQHDVVACILVKAGLEHDCESGPNEGDIMHTQWQRQNVYYTIHEYRCRTQNIYCSYFVVFLIAELV